MIEPELAIDLRASGTIALTGALVDATAATFRAAVDYWPPSVVEIDLRHLELIDLDGLAVRITVYIDVAEAHAAAERLAAERG